MHKNNIKIITAILIATTLLYLGCKDGKNNKSCSDFARNSDEMISDWYFFKLGTFFIYALRDNPNVKDTLSFVSSNYYFYDDLYAVGCGEIHELRLKHSNTKYFPEWNDSSIASETRLEAYFGEYLDFYGGYSGYTAVRFLKSGAVKGTNSGTYEVIDIVENMELNGNTFTNVYHLKSIAEWNKSSNVTELYWSNNYGIISITLSTGLTWELIDYNIIL